MRKTMLGIAIAALAAMAAPAAAQELTAGMQKGDPDLKSAGPLAFAPQGILLAGDGQGGAVFAIATGDAEGKPEEARHQIPGLDEKVAAALGTTAADILIADMAVNPASGKVYLSVARGKGPGAAPAIVVLDGTSKVSELKLKDVSFSKAALPNPSSKRAEAITDLAYVDGRVIVAGLSSEEFASNLRSIPFPFKSADPGASIEIYHGAHGKFETNSPIRTFAVHESQILAAYTCTPLVRIPVGDLKAGSKVKGTTIAELGNRNRPLDMIVYQSGGKSWLLLANNSRGVMKISTDGIDRAQGITEKISGVAGQKYETIAALKGVTELDRLNKSHAVVIVREGAGPMTLATIPLP